MSWKRVSYLAMLMVFVSGACWSLNVSYSLAFMVQIIWITGVLAGYILREID